MSTLQWRKNQVQDRCEYSTLTTGPVPRPSAIAETRSSPAAHKLETWFAACHHRITKAVSEANCLAVRYVARNAAGNH